MRCVAECPNDAFAAEGVELIDLEGGRRVSPAEEATIISCRRRERITPGDFVIPCVGVLTLAHLLAIGMNRSTKVLFNLPACDACENRPAAEHFKKLVKLLQERNRGELNADYEILEEPGTDCRGVSVGRRSFLAGFASSLASLTGARISAEPAEAGIASNRGRRVPRRVSLIKALLERADQKQKQLITSLCQPRLTVSGRCTVCPLCKGMCPTGAISIRGFGTDKSLMIDNALCSGCGLCVTFCKLDALALHKPEEARLAMM